VLRCISSLGTAAPTLLLGMILLKPGKSPRKESNGSAPRTQWLTLTFIHRHTQMAKYKYKHTLKNDNVNFFPHVKVCGSDN